MPTTLFNELDSDKRTKIINVSVAEFATHGYAGSSTNRIIKDAGISKGSLFQYFQNKEELYLYILDLVTSELLLNLESKTDRLSVDLFKRIIGYSELEFSWYIQNPEKYKIVVKAFTKSDTEIYRKVAARYNLAGQDIYNKLLEDIDATTLRWEKQKTADILKWFLKGFNEEFIGNIDTRAHAHTDIENLRDEYTKRLTEYMEMLKMGLLC